MYPLQEQSVGVITNSNLKHWEKVVKKERRILYYNYDQKTETIHLFFLNNSRSEFNTAMDITLKNFTSNSLP